MRRRGDCNRWERHIGAVLDGCLPAAQAAAVEAHAGECRECGQRLRTLRSVRDAMRTLPKRDVSQDLATRLRVLASQEVLRRRTHATLARRWESFRADAGLVMQNIMRPLAIPTAGGFLSALVLFGVLAPVLAVPSVSASANGDVPTVLYVGPSVKHVGPLLSNQDVVIELTVDGEGRLVEYAIQNPGAGVNTPAMRRAIENNLLFTQFTPATTLGQPTRGKVRVSFRSSSIDVKG